MHTGEMAFGRPKRVVMARPKKKVVETHEAVQEMGAVITTKEIDCEDVKEQSGVPDLHRQLQIIRRKTTMI